MKIYIHETILNVYDENHNIIDTSVANTYMLYPDKGKVLYNVLTGLITKDFVGVGREELIKNYIEREI